MLRSWLSKWLGLDVHDGILTECVRRTQRLETRVATLELESTKRTVGMCAAESVSGLGCTRPVSHTGQHYHPSYGYWRVVKLA